MYTPWGQSQYSEKITRGIVFYGTAGHGGIHVSPTKNKLIPEYMRIADGWYEEDCDWAIVACVFPMYFPNFEEAKNSLRNWHPEMYEKFFHESVLPGQSVIRDEQLFHEKHKDDLVVISAVKADNDTVLCDATIGGERGTFTKTVPHRRFIVPAEEYEKRDRNGFIIDLTRHKEASL